MYRFDIAEVCICLVVYAIQRSLYLVSRHNNIKDMAATRLMHSENLLRTVTVVLAYVYCFYDAVRLNSRAFIVNARYEPSSHFTNQTSTTH